jgi:DNA-binding NarL/FixJ family response regulator
MSSSPIPTDNSTILLSTRQPEVLDLLAKGLSNKEMAHRMGLSIRTVDSHVAFLFKKLNVSSRTEAVLLAMRQGIISLQDSDEK